MAEETSFLVAPIKKKKKKTHTKMLALEEKALLFSGKVTLQTESLSNLLHWQQNCICFLSELRQRQEMLMRNQLMAVNPQLMGTGQQRMQAIPSQFEPRLVDRYFAPLLYYNTAVKE